MIEQFTNLIQQSQYMVALTGAGISTPSGIPDFRSHEGGLWEHDDPQQVASLRGFRYQPLAFYQWIRPLGEKVMSAKPNPAHYALSRLEELGILKALITQNIDLLHERAGSQKFYEVHGHLREMTCIECFREFDARPIWEAFMAASEVVVPRCPVCGGVLKPNVVLFEEQLPMQIFLKAQQAVRQADLILVVGSSLEVYPVAEFPKLVKMRGGKLIIINRDTTYLDDAADLVIHDDVATVLPALVQALEGTFR
jgi:NAD-dependent deacetylase